jgi:hypothetical protein
MKPIFLLLALFAVACAGTTETTETDDAAAGCVPGGWTHSQTMWLPTPNDLTSEPRLPDGSVCFELGTRDPGVAFYAPELGCAFTDTCSAMWGGPVEVYTDDASRTEDDVRLAVRIGPCWLFAGGVPE